MKNNITTWAMVTKDRSALGASHDSFLKRSGAPGKEVRILDPSSYFSYKVHSLSMPPSLRQWYHAEHSAPCDPLISFHWKCHCYPHAPSKL